MDRCLQKVSLARASQLFELSSLEFTRCLLTDDQAYALLWTAATGGAKLSAITLTRNSIGRRTATLLAQILRTDTCIESIDLHENEVDDEGAAALGQCLRFNHTLKTLRLSNNEMTPKGAMAIFDGIMRNLGLASVAFEAGGGTQTVGVPLAKLKGLEASHVADLGGQRLGPLSALLVANLIDTYRPELTSLVLDRNPIKAEGAAAIGEMLTRNDDIKELHLRYCNMGADGVTTLAKALRLNSSVERLYIICNQAAEQGCAALVEMLEHNHSLTLIHMDDNLLAPESKQKVLALAAGRNGLTIDV